MNCKYCLCQECADFEECEPCRNDWDYEHPCPGNCDEWKPQSETEVEE